MVVEQSYVRACGGAKVSVVRVCRADRSRGGLEAVFSRRLGVVHHIVFEGHDVRHLLLYKVTGWLHWPGM